ncbi:MAG: transcription factor E [Archaeoglobaceae archaeon]
MSETQTEELIRELIERISGEVGLIIYSLRPKNGFTDEQIASELGIEINDVRKALFSLYEVGVAEYTRHRDDETGWMEYHWKINYDKQTEVLKRELQKTKNKLEEKLETETSTMYYICQNGHVKVSYAEAMELDFMCPKCGVVLEYHDSSVAADQIKEEIKKIEDILDQI